MFLSKEELETMNYKDLKQYSDELSDHAKVVKELLKKKPKVSLFARYVNDSKELYVYSSFYTNGKAKQEYIGKYGEVSTFEMIKELAKDRPKLLDDYEKLKEKLSPKN